MIPIQRTREEPVLPQMTAPVMQPVERQRVLRVRSPQRLRKRILRLRNSNQMDMIRHQAVRVDSDIVAPAVPRQEFEVEFVVGLREKDLLSVVSPLRNVVSNFSKDSSRAPWHIMQVPPRDDCSQIKCVCPLFLFFLMRSGRCACGSWLRTFSNPRFQSEIPRRSHLSGNAKSQCSRKPG